MSPDLRGFPSRRTQRVSTQWQIKRRVSTKPTSAQSPRTFVGVSLKHHPLLGRLCVIQRHNQLEEICRRLALDPNGRRQRRLSFSTIPGREPIWLFAARIEILEAKIRTIQTLCFGSYILAGLVIGRQNSVFLSDESAR